MLRAFDKAKTDRANDAITLTITHNLSWTGRIRRLKVDRDLIWWKRVNRTKEHHGYTNNSSKFVGKGAAWETIN